MSKFGHSRKLIEEMNRYYDARAPWHDQYMSYTSNEAMENLLAPVISVIDPIVKSRTVLEIACGTGNWTQVLAKRAVSVTATDQSLRSLEIAREKVADCKNVTLLQGDAYDLGFVDGSFEVVFAADWWSHIPKAVYPSFLKSVVGTTRAGAKAVFLDMSVIDFFRKESCRYDSDGNRISLRQLPDGSECEVVKNFPDQKALEGILAPYSSGIDFYEFDSLKRWMVVFEVGIQA